mgnify:FL=1|jgi:hypothetical protein|tara:strand:+ start:215 stop:379 length:165 start_codon:yes stop_codon:yes gene_type:complete
MKASTPNTIRRIIDFVSVVIDFPNLVRLSTIPFSVILGAAFLISWELAPDKIIF